MGRGWPKTELFRFGPPKKEERVKEWSERKLVSFWTSRQARAGRVVGNGTSSVSDHPENTSTISNTTIKQYGSIQACWTHKKRGLWSYPCAASFHWDDECQPPRFTLVAIIGIEATDKWIRERCHMTECLRQDMNFLEYPLWFQNGRLAPHSTIMVTSSRADKALFTGAITALQKTRVSLGCPETKQFRFRTPQKPEQRAKITRKHKQSRCVSAIIFFRRP